MNQSLSQLMKFIFKQEDAIGTFAIDVGAHHGEYTKFLISTGFFSSVVSFEPNPISYLKLLDEFSSPVNCKHEVVRSTIKNQ